MREPSLAAVNSLLLRKQHLADDAKIDGAYQIAYDISGLHATGPTTPYLSLFARSRAFLRKHLEDELYVKKRLGRIRCMRGTLHIMTKEMIPIAYMATRKMIRKDLRDILKFRGVSGKEYEDTSKSILNILKGKEMTTSEIKERLGTSANVSAIVEEMCDRGLLIRVRPRAGWKDRINKYSVFREYFPDIDLSILTESEAITELVKHHLRSFGPVTENDLAWWVGMSKTEAREAIDNIKDIVERTNISGLGDDFILLRSDAKHLGDPKSSQGTSVALLPWLDPYMMGYKDRERYLPAEYRDRVFDRGGNATSTILLDGRVVGVWDFAEEENPVVKFILFEKVKEDVKIQVRLEARRVGMFIADNEIRLRECDSMAPLTKKTAGNFMSPLKDC
jgi:hypothetical protein